MNDKINMMNKLSKKFNYNNINFSILNSNIKLLLDYYYELKNILNNIQIEYTVYPCDKNEIINIIKKFEIYKYIYIKNFVNNCKVYIKLIYKNITFYYISQDNYDKDLELIKKLFRITLIMSIFSKNDKDIIVVWIPVDKKRNFDYQYIDNDNLKETEDNFEAFVASGVTNDNTTIISRYEEIEKLLLHELIHNLNLDGSDYHSYLRDIIKDYNTNNNYKYEYSIYESYTELLSSYLNILFSLMNDEQTNIEERIKARVIIEYIYSCNVLANLLSINKYQSYQEFIDNDEYFKGNICTYEYYYLKCPMYNNFKLLKLLTKQDFKQNLINIMDIDKTNRDIDLSKYVKDTNFRYIYFA
jgi:hypothetical protein